MTYDAVYGPGEVILERYEMVRVLGSGGWGRVYLANDRLLRRPVAMKQLLPRLAADPAAVSRFNREASSIASIRDPYVLTIYDIAEDDGQHYMAMEYGDAGTLAQMMQLEGALSPYEALSVAIDVCKGLRAIHLKGIVHRDVKPANVMFFSRTDNLPIAKLGDFGIALQSEDERLTPSDNVVGTLIYLSPEQASSSRIITSSSDLYSLGAMIYEMITGELQEPVFANPIFAGKSSDVFQKLGALPEPVRPLLIKALQRKPEDRFQSADEMLQALERSRSRLTASFSTHAFAQVVPAETQPAPKSKLPARLLAATGVTLTLLVGGAMAAFGLGAGPAKPAEMVSSIPTPAPTHTATFTVTPTPTLTPSPSPILTPTPSPSPSPSPSPPPTEVVARPTRVKGPASLTLLFHDSSNVPNGIYAVSDASAASPPSYLEGSYLWGEIATRIGDTVFQINRSNLNRKDPAQHLPSYLRLNVEYSTALLAAMQDLGTKPPGFDAQTGEFWVGRFRCGSAVRPEDSPYWIAVQLLKDSQEIANRRYVISVVDNPSCQDNSKTKGPVGPPTNR